MGGWGGENRESGVERGRQADRQDRPETETDGRTDRQRETERGVG